MFAANGTRAAPTCAPVSSRRQVALRASGDVAAAPALAPTRAPPGGALLQAPTLLQGANHIVSFKR